MRRGFFALLVAAFLAGCVPPGIVPQQTEIQGNSIGLGAQPAPDIGKDWWTAFGDAELDRLVSQGLANNPSLGQALARLRAAKAGVDTANASLYPHVDLDAQEQRLRLSNIYIYPPPYAGTFRWIGTIGANLSWNLDFWGKQAAQLEKAKSLENAARLDSAAAHLAVAGAVVGAYIDLDRAYKLADIAAQTEADRKNTLTVTQRRVKDGLDSRVEEEEARALLSEAREAKIGADSARDIVVHELAALIGRGADAYASIPRPQLNLAAMLTLPDALPADLLARRPDILAAQARIDAALAGRKAAKAAFYPDVNLLATAGWAAIGLGPLFSAASLQYGGGPAIHLPIFDAGELRAEYAGAVADIDLAIADYNGTLTEAVRETADALTHIHSLQDQTAEHRRTLDAADMGYRLAQSRYRSGLTNQLTVLDAEAVLLDARQGDVSLVADSAVQRITLLLAVGGGFQPIGAAPPAASSQTETKS